MKKPFTGTLRTLLQVLFIVLGLWLVAIPPLVLFVHGPDTSDVLWVSLRLAALEAFTLIFIDITVGSFRAVFVRIYKGHRVQYVHQTIAIAALAVGVGHGLMAFVNGLSDYTNVVWIGPAVLAALVAVIVTALMRKRFRLSWLWVHRLNYLIFAAIVVHGLLLGYDLDKETSLKVCFAVYMAVVVSGLAYRIVTQLSKTRAKA